ncbi:hypothetical protein RQP46_005461 [Phenoliferia psychrophenolica]
MVVLSKDEIARIQSKAIKLAFNRDIEIIASTTQPASTLATFSFTIPSSPSPSTKTPVVPAGTAADWDSALFPTASAAPATETTYHASCLLVWSHADAARSEAIRATLKGGSKARSEAINRGAKAASAGRKLGARLERQMASPMGAVLRERREWSMGDFNDGDTDGGYATETEWGDSPARSRSLAPMQGSHALWIPIALVLVSQIPIYNLLSDVLRISWARYHKDPGLQSRHMRLILNSLSPRPGDKVEIPVSVNSEQADTRFVARMPGKVNWDHSVQTMDLNFAVWPLFRALDADTLLTIAEDPGPWLIAIPTQSRLIALADLPPEVAVVDLDSNAVRVLRPHPGALSTGTTREKARKRLSDAIGNVSSYYAIPEEWDQERTLLEFDAILTESPRPGRIAKLVGAKPLRKRVHLDPVDRRDLLESRINRLNAKLASLMTESADWQKSLETFQAFSDKLTSELEEVQTVRAALEQQKHILTSEIQAVLSADESSPLYEAVYARLDALSHRSDTSSRPGTSQSLRSGRHYRPASVAFSEEDLTEDQKHAGEDPEEEEAHLDRLKQASEPAGHGNAGRRIVDGGR